MAQQAHADRRVHRDQLTGYYAPKNFNIWYFFGSLALVVLVLQLVTGIFLTMFYKPGELTSFDSVEYIMREVDWGWLIRYLHSTGASAFFIVVYLHMFRALLYGSYKAPRELLWLIGMLVYLALMAEAFLGYVLPWGNMSFWGAQVIVNLFGTIPGIGPGLVGWIRGDYGIADATLNRFFALHVAAVPLALLLLVMLHLVALRQTGSNNPDGIEIKERVGADGHPLDGIPFHPYYTVKDIVGDRRDARAASRSWCSSCRRFGGLFLEAPNFEPANPMSTPEHIAPVWYFTPYYAILRAVPDQRLGALLMFLAVVLVPVPAVAGPLAGEIDALSRLAVARRAGAVCRLLRRARLPRPAAGRRAVRDAGAHLRGPVFRLLPADAVVHEHRQGEARAREGDLSMRTEADGRWLGTRAARAAMLAERRCASRERSQAAEEPRGRRRPPPGRGADWAELAARNNDVSNMASLQRGARNFISYCLGCHSLKYER